VLGSATQQTADAVALNPGISRTRLAATLGGRRPAALAVIDDALAQHLIHVAPTLVESRAGRSRSAAGLFPGDSSPAGAATLDGPSLRRCRIAAGVSKRGLAARLGVDESALRRWEGGDRPVASWVAGRLDGALEAAGKGAAPGRQRGRRDLLRVVRLQPGLSRFALAPRPTARHALAQALEAGLVHEAPSSVRGPRGGRHPCSGIFPGAAPKIAPPPAPSGREIRAAREAAGKSLLPVAKALGIDISTLADWERGRSPVPPFMAARAREQVEHLHTATGDLEDRLAAYVVAHPGISIGKLTRGTHGRTNAVLGAVQRLMAAGRIHEQHAASIDSRAVVRHVPGLFPGPLPHSEPAAMYGTDLELRRRAAGLSRLQFAQLAGVSDTQILYWERGTQPISASRAVELDELLAGLPISDVFYVDDRHFTDDELAGALIAAATAGPGRLAGELAKDETIAGSMQRRLAAINRLVEVGALRSETVVRIQADGRTFRRPAIYPGNHVLADPSIA
jgi:transcriptional regulator with XRE-family HTH domain